jgi:hypothetical protein
VVYQRYAGIARQLACVVVFATAATGCISVKFIFPGPNAVVGSRVTLHAQVTDDNPDYPPTAARFSLDGAPLGDGPCSGSDCTLDWDSTTASQGWHKLGARHDRGILNGTDELDVRVPSACFDHTPSGPSDYQVAFDSRRGGWAGADSPFPVSLPDGKVLWIFSDTYVGDIDSNNALVPGARLLSGNTFQVQSGTCFTPSMGGTPTIPQVNIPTGVPNSWYWPTSGYADTSVDPPLVRVTAMFVRRSSCGFGWLVSGTDIITLSLPDLAVVSKEHAPIDVTAENMPALNSSMVDGQYVYFYGHPGGYQCDGFRPGGPFARGTYVARALSSAPSEPWDFWDGGGWSSDVNFAVPMAVDGSGDPPARMVTKYGDGYLATGKVGLVGFFTPQVLGWYAPTPEGPWHSLGEVVPGSPSLPGSRIYYGGQLVTNVPGSSEHAPIAVYSTNGAGGPDGTNSMNVLLYGPHFVRPNLPSAATLAELYPVTTTTTTTTTSTSTTTTTTTEPEPTTTTTEPEPTTTTTEPEATTTTTEEPTTTTTEPEP